MKSLRKNIGVILVTFRTPNKQIIYLKKRFKIISSSCRFYLWDNTLNNRGFAYGVNQGIKKALKDKIDILIIANTDISVPLITQKDMSGLLALFDIGGLAFKQKGKMYFGGEIDRWYLSGGLILKKPDERYQTADFVSGSFMIIKKDVIRKIGLFDENYFMYYEDVDYCLRAKKAGLKVGIDSQIVYNHLELNNSAKKIQLLHRAYKIFFRKHANLLQKTRFFIKNNLKI